MFPCIPCKGMVTTYKIIQHNSPKVHNKHTHDHENLKSQEYVQSGVAIHFLCLHSSLVGVYKSREILIWNGEMV
jgi:hypothetical protein